MIILPLLEGPQSIFFLDPRGTAAATHGIESEDDASESAKWIGVFDQNFQDARCDGSAIHYWQDRGLIGNI
jgi:hypothetical protein